MKAIRIKANDKEITIRECDALQWLMDHIGAEAEIISLDDPLEIQTAEAGIKETPLYSEKQDKYTKMAGGTKRIHAKTEGRKKAAQTEQPPKEERQLAVLDDL